MIVEVDPSKSVTQAGSAGELSQRAVVHLGASAVSMTVVEYSPDRPSSPEVLEMLEQPLPMAEDVFRNGELSRPTIERCVRILGRFAITLREYGLEMGRDVDGIATNILGEARNSEVLYNRLKVACGIDVRALDEGDMTRLIYSSVVSLVKRNAELKKARLLAIHLGPGNTRVMLINRGRIEQYNSYRMGAHRVIEAVERMPSDSDSMSELIGGHINGTIEQIEASFGRERIEAIMAVGQEIQLAAQYLEGQAELITVECSALRRLMQRLVGMEDSEIASRLDSNRFAAHAVPEGLVCYLAIVNRLGHEKIYVPGGRFQERFLTALARDEFPTKRFSSEVIQSARALGKKYRYDGKHGRHVAALGVKIYDELQEVLGLPPQDRLLLEVAAIVHEVGSFISRRNHHKHSLYIIANSEIFGLNDEETKLVALVARYHRRSLPQPVHPVMRDLSREGRIRVAKLAALLRVADALDRSHTQRLEVHRARVDKDRLLLHVGNMVNVKVEELALNSKADLFEQVFGLEVVLETG